MKQNSELRDLCCLCGESFLCSFDCGSAARGLRGEPLCAFAPLRHCSGHAWHNPRCAERTVPSFVNFVPPAKIWRGAAARLTNKTTSGRALISFSVRDCVASRVRRCRICRYRGVKQDRPARDFGGGPLPAPRPPLGRGEAF